MSAPRKARSDLLDHLAYVEFHHSSVSYLDGGDPHEEDTLQWTVTATIHSSPDGEDGAGWMDRADVSLSPPALDREGGTTVDIFQMSGFTVDLDRVRSLSDALDSFSADTAHFLEVVDDHEPGHLARELDEQLESLGSAFVVFDRAQVAPAWRGLGGVGRLLTGYALRWVAANARCVVGQPFPFEVAARVGGDRSDDSSPEIVAELAQVRHVWTSLGFFPYRDDLFVFDPAMAEMDNAVRTLEKKLLRG